MASLLNQKTEFMKTNIQGKFKIHYEYPDPVTTPVPPPLTVTSIVASYQDPSTILKKTRLYSRTRRVVIQFCGETTFEGRRNQNHKAAALKETNAGLKRKNIDDSAPAKAKTATKVCFMFSLLSWQLIGGWG